MVDRKTYSASPEEADLKQDEASNEQNTSHVIKHLDLLSLRSNAMLHPECWRVVEEYIKGRRDNIECD